VRQLIIANNVSIDSNIGELLLSFAIRNANLPMITYLSSLGIYWSPYSDLFVSHYTRSTAMGDGDFFVRVNNGKYPSGKPVPPRAGASGNSTLFTQIITAINNGYNEYRTQIYNSINTDILLDRDSCYVITSYLIGDNIANKTQLAYHTDCFIDMTREPEPEEEEEELCMMMP
jgi:hypothetical protein